MWLQIVCPSPLKLSREPFIWSKQGRSRQVHLMMIINYKSFIGNIEPANKPTVSERTFLEKRLFSDGSKTELIMGLQRSLLVIEINACFWNYWEDLPEMKNNSLNQTLDNVAIRETTLLWVRVSWVSVAYQCWLAASALSEPQSLWTSRPMGAQ